VTPKGKGAFRDYQRYMGLGLQLPLTILAGCFLGYLADKRFGTEPWLLIVGAAIGMAVGFTSFIYIVLKGEKQAQERDRKDEEG
jgi:F0F1-type ATP synthase assembly protein I